MKKVWKKNQVIITALAIMIAVAGYLNFTSDKQVLNTSVENMESEGATGNSDDATVSAAVEDSVVTDDYAEVTVDSEAATDNPETDVVDVSANTDEKAVEEEGAKEGEADDTGEDVASVSLDENGDPIDSDTVGEAVLTSGTVTLSQAKLTREQTRSKAKEMLLEIINNESLTEDAKKEAVAKMLSMTERMEKETAAENQLASKGFQDAVVSISDESVDVSVPMSSITDKQRTQIEDVVTRKTGCELNQVVITTVQ
ncbi:MAG: SpoIIIAH-like family protein [Lachnospiraceae bacterium]|nr:SpoIIIAH-like family protein [Lachnospiraceae bacterium]